MVLSFVVPAFNEEFYLADCLESILRQTRGLEHITEIIVVNNASSDGTREVALRYPQVGLVDEPRKGLTYARQAGFLASTGTLIANVDADSRLTTGWVDHVMSAFQVAPSLAALSGPLVYYDLTRRQRFLVHVFYLFAWMMYVTNRYILRVGSMVQGGNFVVDFGCMVVSSVSSCPHWKRPLRMHDNKAENAHSISCVQSGIPLSTSKS